jgi:peptidoglycan/LPS O-acetylase OafA/YrhL
LLFLPLVRSRRAAGFLLVLLAGSPLLALGGLLLMPPRLLNVLPCIPYLSGGCLLAVLLHMRQRTFDRLRQRRSLRRAALWLLPPCAVAASCFKRDGQDLELATVLEALVMPLATFAIVAESVMEDGLLRRALSIAPLRWLGLASYSTYLWQQLFLGPPEVYRNAWFWTAWPQNVLASLACGALAYWLVERPSSGLKKRLSRRGGRAAASSKPPRLPGPAPSPSPAASAACRSARTADPPARCNWPKAV